MALSLIQFVWGVSADTVRLLRRQLPDIALSQESPKKWQRGLYFKKQIGPGRAVPQQLREYEEGLFDSSAGAGKGVQLTLRCSSDFIITEAEPHLCALLKYGPQDLIGLSILDLMSSVVADAHKGMFRHLTTASKEELGRIGAHLMHMSRCRDFVMLDFNKEPVMCRIAVMLYPDLSSQVIVESIQGKIPHSVPRGFGQHIRRPAGLHLVDSDNVVCIMMDIAGTTSFAASQPPRVMAELLHKVYVTANYVVEKEALPYVYIHEIVGDSLLLICNADFMVRHRSRTAAISIYVAMRVQKALDEMLSTFAGGDHGMYARVGIAMGPVSAGVVDGRSFRVFGSTVHLSQRLESICPRSKITCCLDFAKLLRQQVDEDVYSTELLCTDAKGLGPTECSVVELWTDQLLGQEW